MNTTLLLNQTNKEVERAKMQVAVDAKAAQQAHELARAAKVNLKQVRKLSKMAKKLARKAEDRAEESSATLETAQAKLEMLRERIRNERRKNNPSPKSKPGKTTMDTTPRVSPVQSLRSTKPAARRVPGGRRSAQKTINGKPAKPAPAVTPEPKPVPAARQKLGGLNPLPAPIIDAPSLSGQKPAND
jgi:hypothetical protein